MEEITTLTKLLKSVALYHPHYDDRLATHLPMGLIALKRLNASDKKLKETFNNSIIGLDHIGNLDEIVAIDNLTDHLGESSKYSNYLKYFMNEIKSHGADFVLTTVLPILIPGLAASAFHALIRLAYAIEENNESEIAIALAFWCAEFQSLPIDNKTTPATLSSILEELAPLGTNHQFSPGIIVDRMGEISTLLKQNNIIIQPEVINFNEIRDVALTAFNTKNDFTLLHTVTGCHAFSIILPYLADQNSALRALWKAILVAYLSTGLNFNSVKIRPSSLDCDFDNLIKHVIQSTDVHAIKLVYSCSCEYLKDKEPMYYAVAKRAVFGEYK